jgi:type VI secretion system secreted protein VgrG
MPTYTQAGRPLAVTTPLEDDALLLTGFAGQEGLSRLFSYHLDLLAGNGQEIPFEQILGQGVTVALEMPGDEDNPGGTRYFHGICSRLSQGEVGEEFTDYDLEIVPAFWLLSKRWQSRIFQHQSVPDILQEVLEDLDVEFRLQGTFPARDYCVQYRESDFAFASRLMEEEGIYYFFEHAEDGHTLVLANTPQGHPELPDGSELVYRNVDSSDHDDPFIYDWGKWQALRPEKYTLWDHCFELPGSHLAAEEAIRSDVQVGGVGHKLKVSPNGRMEIYDYPGRFAQRFDGVDRGGSDRAEDLQQIFADGTRTAKIRMQEEATVALTIQAVGTYRHLAAGHKFTLRTLDKNRERQLGADGPYVLTGIQHSARLTGGYRSGAGGFHYHNNFTCIPFALPFRPLRVTPRPIIHGAQTAVVVGMPDDDIFTDKYGRVKVQFHWDREGQNDADSSCWIRVGTPWAGQHWGMVHIPRVGQEVIVNFLEGDPDQPIITGSVYNAAMMPPYDLPANRTQSGIKSRSTVQGTEQNFNELRFEDKKDSEEVYFHAEKDFNRVVENNDTLKVGSDQAADGSQTIEIYKDRTETVKTGNEQVTIEQGNRTITVSQGNDKLEVAQGNREVVVQGNDTHQIKQGDRTVKIEMGNDVLHLSSGDHRLKIDLGKSETEAMQSIELKVGQSSIKLDQCGITLKGVTITIEGQVATEMKGAMTTVNGDGMLTLKGGITTIN